MAACLVSATTPHILASFPDGCTVGLRLAGTSESHFASFTSSPHADHGSGKNDMLLRGHCQDWEHFALIKHGDGSVSLQDIGGGFVSPRNLQAGLPWVARREAPQGGWERLYFEEAGGREGSHILAKTFVIFTKPRGGASVYLAADATSGLIRTAIDPAGISTWEVSIRLPPVVRLFPVGGFAGLGEALRLLAGASGLAMVSREADIVLQLLRAMLDVGAFFVTGHGVSGSEALMHEVIQAVGRLPYRDDALAGDASFKQNVVLVEKKGWGAAVEPAVHGDGAAIRALSRSVFDETEALCDALLHALALGQQLGSGSDAPPKWRGQWRHEALSLTALRALAYHPGPIRKPDGAPVVTTARHTDSTWLTVLRQDGGAGGLEIRPRSGAGELVHPGPPFPGALLVNCGNLLETASGGFFRAVCHRVVRRSDTDTRVSIVYFYDRLAGDAWHAGGTLGC